MKVMLRQKSTVSVFSPYMCSFSRIADAAIYERAKTVGPLQRDIEQLVTAVLARASYEWRGVRAGTISKLSTQAHIFPYS